MTVLTPVTPGSLTLTEIVVSSGTAGISAVLASDSLTCSDSRVCREGMMAGTQVPLTVVTPGSLTATPI